MTRTMQQRQASEKTTIPGTAPDDVVTQDEPVGRVLEGDDDTKPSRLPDGVQMHHAEVMPSAPLEHEPERDPRRPPRGHVGSYERCGGCGDSLPMNAKACPRCAPSVVPSNISMTMAPKVIA